MLTSNSVVALRCTSVRGLRINLAKDKVGRLPVKLGVSKSVGCDTFSL